MGSRELTFQSTSSLSKSEDPSTQTPPSRSSSGWPSLVDLSRIRTRRQTLGPAPPKTTLDVIGPLGLNLLSDPPAPRVDFIFVHGLKGGSRKTWTHESGPDTFWPQEWLRADPEFKHVRIHSFGYNSNWSKLEESILGIQDFGQALLTDMFNSPHLRKNEDTRIVLIAHSMGGLVVKQAYLLAKQNKLYENFVKRIQAMYFLATPHRGSNMAQVLSRFLSVSGLIRPKKFVGELIPGCSTLETINEEFSNASSGLRIWSFFETKPMKSFLIVEKDSAIIGIPGEQVRYLDADHRQVCKFESPTNPNYRIVRNCLLMAVQDAGKDSDMKEVADFLKVDGKPETDFLELSEKQAPGTCAWLTDHRVFKSWLPEHPENIPGVPLVSNTEQRPRFFWLHGPPGSGKSVMCSHVTRFLEGCGLHCHYYFIKHEHAQDVTPARLLCSMAFQMAACNPDVRNAILDFATNNRNFSHNDQERIWNELFVNNIFKTSFHVPQVWIIDGLDEFPAKALDVLLGMFSRIPLVVPLQVFLASRSGVHVPRALGIDQKLMVELEIGEENTKSDITSFLRSQRSSSLGIELSESVISKVLSKSKGIFLWVSLILDELREAYTEEDMERALQDVPGEMNDLYFRTAQTIARNPHNLKLVRSIFTWMICAPHPLLVTELHGAVRADVNRTLAVSDDRLVSLCGNLIEIDRESKVHFIHETVSSFIMNGESELKIMRAAAHRRLAEVCLRYLTGPDFPPPKLSRHSSQPSTIPNDQPTTFTEYACSHFSFHLAQCEVDFQDLLILLEAFFSSNVLSWIEHLAKRTSRSLLRFDKSIQNLRIFVSKCAKDVPVPNRPLDLVTAWLNDLSHVLGSFGQHILRAPSCIHSMIPVISPPQSLIHQTFTKSLGRYKLLGMSQDKGWGERLQNLVYSDKPTAVAVSDHYVAVGFSVDGRIDVTDDIGASVKLQHGQGSVRNVIFGPKTESLVAYSPRKISFWNKNRDLLWTKTVAGTRSPLSVAFSVEEDRLLVCGRDGHIYIVSATDGSNLDELPLFHADDSDWEDGPRKISPGTPPWKICMSPVHGLAAITYRCSPVIIWDTQRRRKEGVFFRPGTESVYQQVQVHDLVFNPSLHRDLLAIAYDGVGIVTCNPWVREQLDVVEIEARILVSSLDGRMLFVGDVNNAIHILTFEPSPKVLHYIAPTSRDLLRSIAVSPNGLCFCDLRGYSLNRWELPAFLRGDITAAGAIPKDALTGNEMTRSISALRSQDSLSSSHITCIASFPDNKRNLIFCGRRNGDITVYDAAKATRLFDFSLDADHQFPVKFLQWHEQASILVAVSSIDYCMAARISVSQRPAGPCDVIAQPLFSRYVDHPVRGVLINNTGDLFHIATSEGGEVWNEQGERVGLYTINDDDSSDLWGTKRQWLQHPMEPHLLLMLQTTRVHLFRWETLEELTPAPGLSLTITGPGRASDPKSTPPAEWISQQGLGVIFQLSPGRKSLDREITYIDFLDLNTLAHAITIDSESEGNGGGDDGNRSAKSVALTRIIAPFSWKAAIGLHKPLFYFVDTEGWVNSFPIKVLPGQPVSQWIGWKSFRHHFFIPDTWSFNDGLRLCLLRRSSSIAMAAHDEIVIFYRFLDLEEVRDMEPEYRGLEAKVAKDEKHADMAMEVVKSAVKEAGDKRDEKERKRKLTEGVNAGKLLSEM